INNAIYVLFRIYFRLNPISFGVLRMGMKWQNVKSLTKQLKQDYLIDHPDSSFINMIARNVFVYLSAYIILYTKIGPNHITFIMLLFQLAGAFCYLLATPFYYILGSILLYSGFALDDIDGEIARHKKMGSQFGIYFDYLVHQIAYPLIYICLGLGIYFDTGNNLYLYLGFIWALLIKTEIFFFHTHIHNLNIGDKLKEIQKIQKDFMPSGLPIKERITYEFKKNFILFILKGIIFPFLYLGGSFPTVYFIVAFSAPFGGVPYVLYLYVTCLTIRLIADITRDIKILRVYDRLKR
ncbi:MAG: CDP-alcohol phosphatidyltransferase family protein, partial [Spirochaetota bacterium]|nr:CDP-alcohol phosphatidyltransferase family protein [Spirochaetota bacterium]